MTGVLLDIQDRIAVITLDRPDAGNRVDDVIAISLAEACTAAERDDAVRVVVLGGAGGSFCEGTEPEPPAGREAFGRLRASAHVALISKPVIAAINGDAIDQGLELALACDLRVASSSARLGLTHITRGLIPWDGGTQRLPRLIGLGRATELVMTGRLIDGDEAYRIGLVNEAVPPGQALDSALFVASRIAAHGPAAQRYAKEAVTQGQDLTLGQGLRLEADLSFLLHGTADREEGIASFRERRPPEYRD